jgi:hypothetical protein
VTKALALALLVAGCAGNLAPTADSQPGHLDRLVYEAPVDWSATDGQTLRGPSSTWLPADNARKESLIVSRVQVQPGRPAYTVEALQGLLAAAQQELPHARLSDARSFVTPTGLRGASIEADFTPRGSTSRYHRVHAVVLDGDHLVHVLYTAQQPDFSHRAFDLIVNSLHEEG